MGDTFVPWRFLDAEARGPTPSPPIAMKKTFAQALNHACDIPLSQLPVPCMKGDALAVTIPEEDYQAGLEESKKNLHGRILLSKGDPLIKVQDLRVKLAKIWQPIAK